MTLIFLELFISDVQFSFHTQGLISYEDFKRVFQSAEDGDMESKTVGTVGASTIESVPPKPIPELVDMLKVCVSRDCVCFLSLFFLSLQPTGPEEAVNITEELLQNFKVKVCFR